MLRCYRELNMSNHSRRDRLCRSCVTERGRRERRYGQMCGSVGGTGARAILYAASMDSTALVRSPVCEISSAIKISGGPFRGARKGLEGWPIQMTRMIALQLIRVPIAPDGRSGSRRSRRHRACESLRATKAPAASKPPCLSVQIDRASLTTPTP